MALRRSRRQLKRQADDDIETPTLLHPALRTLCQNNPFLMESMASSPSSVASSPGPFNLSAMAADFPLCAACAQCFCIQDTVALACNHALCKGCFQHGCSPFPSASGTSYGVQCPMCSQPSSWPQLPFAMPWPQSAADAMDTSVRTPTSASARGPQSGAAAKRIMHDLRALRKFSQPQFQVELVEGNLLVWRVMFIAPTPLELLMSFPQSYPSVPPLIRVLSPATLQQSQLVTADGSVCLTSLLARAGGWSVSADLGQLLLAVYAQLAEAIVEATHDDLMDDHADAVQPSWPSTSPSFMR
eukprot:m.126251 g.126251  ORF g.126251 m.126251 type:complete len:300 (+) comp15769_c0_seq3:69-968(+)